MSGRSGKFFREASSILVRVRQGGKGTSDVHDLEIAVVESTSFNMSVQTSQVKFFRMEEKFNSLYLLIMWKSALRYFRGGGKERGTLTILSLKGGAKPGNICVRRRNFRRLSPLEGVWCATIRGEWVGGETRAPRSRKPVGGKRGFLKSFMCPKSFLIPVYVVCEGGGRWRVRTGERPGHSVNCLKEIAN